MKLSTVRAATRSHVALLTALLSVSLITPVSGCDRSPPPTPEEEIRRTVAEMEKLAEEKDLGKLKGYIAENYSDERRNTKQDLVAYIQFYFLRNKDLHLLLRVDSVEKTEQDYMHAIVLGALTGTEVASASELKGVRASLYRFDLYFSQIDDEWKLAGAEWRQAQLTDFF